MRLILFDCYIILLCQEDHELKVCYSFRKKTKAKSVFSSFVFFSVSKEISLYQWSESTDRRVEEDPAREVRVAPLREGCLLLEVALDCGVVLRIKHIMILLIGRLELLVLEVFYSVVLPTSGALRALIHLFGPSSSSTGAYWSISTRYICRVPKLDGWQTAISTWLAPSVPDSLSAWIRPKAFIA